VIEPAFAGDDVSRVADAEFAGRGQARIRIIVGGLPAALVLLAEAVNPLEDERLDRRFLEVEVKIG
jgi:hypothetical protein